MDVWARMGVGRVRMMRFCLFPLYIHATACAQCPTDLPDSLTGRSDVALARNRAHFVSRVDRDAVPSTNSGTAGFDSTGGPGPVGLKTGAVVFDSSLSYLNAGGQEMKIASSGFTVVAVVMFTGTPNTPERILAFGGSDGLTTIELTRSHFESTLQFVVSHKSVMHIITIDQGIIQGTWQTILAQYHGPTHFLKLRIGDKTISDTWLTPRTDYTFTKMYIGRSQAGNPFPMTGKIAGLYAVDRFLSNQEVSDTINDIYLNKDLFDTWCGHACEPGYSVHMDTMTCKVCPTGEPASEDVSSNHYCNACVIPTNDERSSNPAFVCLCNWVTNVYECSCATGYEGNGSTCICNAVECIECPIGTYNAGSGNCIECPWGTHQANTGSTECTECPWGEYSNTTGAVSADVCTECDFQEQPRSDGGGCERCAISFDASVLTSASSGNGKMPGCIEFVE